MIKKGVISNTNENLTLAEVVIPEENNVVTPLLPFSTSIANVQVGNRCIVAFPDTDTVNLADGVIIAIY